MKLFLLLLTIAVFCSQEVVVGQAALDIDEMPDTTDMRGMVQPVWNSAKQAFLQGLEAANQAAAQSMAKAILAMENAGNRMGSTEPMENSQP